MKIRNKIAEYLPPLLTSQRRKL